MLNRTLNGCPCACRTPEMSFSAVFFAVIFFVGLTIAGCGGGSSGTGTTTSRVFEGSILTLGDRPVSDATVTVAGTGDTAVTDNRGRFSLATPAKPGDVKLEIEAPGIETSVTIPELAASPSTVKLDITLDPETSAAAVSKFEVVAKITGSCELFFNSDQIVTQISAVPPGTRCLLRVWVNEDGIPQARVPFGLQYRSCEEGSPWVTIDSSKTLSGEHAGIGQLGFDYLDDEIHCVYRIVTPFRSGTMESVVQEIQTLTYQNRSNL